MDNRLATIVFVDMQGYTKRSAQQTIDEMKVFHDEMFGFVKQHVDKYAGFLVKSLGDGFLIRFDSPTNAVQCGLEMQRKLESRNANVLNPDSIVRFRIGINTGDVGIDENGDLFGDPVNIASRIQSYAEPSEVYISEATYLAMNRNEFGTQDLGPQSFKNATREVRIYKILKNGSPGVTVPKSGTESDATAKPVFAGLAALKPYILGAVIGGIVILAIIGGVRSFRGLPLLGTYAKSGNAPSPLSGKHPFGPIRPLNPDSGEIASFNNALSDVFLDPLSTNTAQLLGNMKVNQILRENLGRIRAMRDSGDKVGALRFLENAMKEQPVESNKPGVKLLEAQLLMENGRATESMEILNFVKETLPNNYPQREKVEKRIANIMTLASPSNEINKPSKDLKPNQNQQEVIGQIRAQREAGDRVGALRALEIELKEHPDQANKRPVQLFEARLLKENGRATESEEILSVVEKSLPADMQQRANIEKQIASIRAEKLRH
ncbi:MAG: hypothetical protein HQM09_03570 [Candidatus Riflebacteria bacterium]|nr:hypothetical protein [Candidatus Riflebacteria bacterium]